jgi:hypothetical protein
MSDGKVVDAIASEPVNRGTTTVPVKIDTSALSAAMSQIAASQMQQQTENVNPADVLTKASASMVDLYARYEVLRELGAFFQGKTFSDPVPANVTIENVTIRFRPTDGADAKEAKIYAVACVGDIAQLISMEMGLIIATLQKETTQVSDIFKLSADTLDKARAAWDAGNKDRKIVDNGANKPVVQQNQPT